MALPKVTVNGCKLRLPAIDSAVLGKVGSKTIDMTPHAGQLVRVWIDKDGRYTTDPKAEHAWQVAELRVPEPDVRIEMVIDEQTGEPVEQQTVEPIDLAAVPITLWPVP